MDSRDETDLRFGSFYGSTRDDDNSDSYPADREGLNDSKDDIFERLHKRGRYMIQQRRELDLQRRISELKRDLALDMQCKKKKAKQQSSMEKVRRQDVNTRLYTSRAHKTNEAGKKLREEIANKNKRRDYERETGFHL